MPEYIDFKIIITSKHQDIYSVRTDRFKEIAEATGEFKMSLHTNTIQPATDNPQVIERKMKIISNTGNEQPDINYTAKLDDNEARNFGNKLSDAVFSVTIAVKLGEFKAECKRQNASLRIRIDLTGAPELSALPWEYLRTIDDGNFLCLDEKTTLVRYLQADVVPKPFAVNYDLKVLVVASMPKDWVHLDTNGEIKNIRDKLAEFNNSVNRIRVEILTEANSDNIEEHLRKARDDNDPFQVLHFIGHGKFNEERRRGELLFEDNEGNGVPYSDEDFANLLQPFNSDLRLIVLNSCEGARASAADSYSSVAAKIIQTAEIPSVIAMQFSITDDAAKHFANYFYSSLAEGDSIEQAVYEARKKVKESYPEEWATPVLYLSADDGHLFNLKVPKVDRDLETHYSTLKDLLQECRYVIFLGLDVNLLNRPSRDPWEMRYGFPGTVELCSYFSNILNINPRNNSLAGLATQLDINDRNLNNFFTTIFKPLANPSKLYETLARITKFITDKLPDQAEDISRSGLLFVTTTFDSNLEEAFQRFGVNNYHVISYDEDDSRNPVFSRKSITKENHNPKKLLITPDDAQTSDGLKNKYPVILKLQGQNQVDSSLIVSEDDFIAFTGKERAKLIPQALTAQIISNRHLYLGYNLQDWSLRMLWSWLCQGQNLRERSNSSAIIGINDPNVHFWSKYRIDCESVDFDDYVKGLEEMVLKKLEKGE